MGMSASQARLLSLQARQSDLEYQGQQINQERSVLSQQVTGLYNSLLTLSVPTPPSTSDYTTVEYAGTVGATSYTFDASSVKPGKNNETYGQTYVVTLFQNDYGHSLAKESNIAYVNNNAVTAITVSDASSEVQKTSPDGAELYYTTTSGAGATAVTGKYQKVDSSGNPLYYEDATREKTTTTATAYPVITTDTKNGSHNNKQLYETTTKPTPGTAMPVMVSAEFSESEIQNLYIVVDGMLVEADKNTHFEPVQGKDDVYKLKDEYRGKLKVQSNSGNAMNIKSSLANVTVQGHNIYTIADAAKLGKITPEQEFAYGEAIEHSGITNPDGSPLTEADFYIYFNDEGQTCFVRTTDIEDGNNNAITYTYLANGEFNKATTQPDCKLEFDPTSGRITSLSLPIYAKDENGYTTSTIEGWTTMEVAATTVTDEAAYEDAYNRYEYEKYQYDKTQADINAKTEVIQQMDRNLELKLQRLDDERNQITNEIQALEKVISENIEASYKTFSG